MKDLIKSIFNILKYGGKAITVLRNIIVNTIFILLIVIVCFLLVKEEEPAIQKDKALLLSISGDIVDEKQIIDPISELFNEALGGSQFPEETLLQDILDGIHEAAEDSRIKAIVLDLSQMGSASFDQIRDIGHALEYFKLGNKPVIAAEDFYSQNSYLLASYADKVFLNPTGLVDLHGLGAYRLYYSDALEKLKINYNVFRVGTYKSAIEPITRNSMSEEAKLQNEAWLDALWQEYLNNIMTRRKIARETLDQYTNNITPLLRKAGGNTGELALQTGLVDELKTRQQLRSYLAEISGRSSDGSFRYVTLRNYLKKVSRSYTSNSSSSNEIGIIVAQGNIVTGLQPPGTIGSDTMITLLRQARENQNIKAVVLRINSGGGSVFASEMIRRELLELQESGKPCVISMGSVAASGGYWISAEADEIWAYPTTITGSIGIFGVIPTFEKSLAHLGIYSDGTGTTKLAAGLDLTRPLSEDLKSSIQLSIENGYEKFLEIVATGRNIDREKLITIAEGRVFDGRTAKEIGLVDQLGSLQDAIASAAAIAGVEDYSGRYIKSTLSFSERVLKQLQLDAQSLFRQWRTNDKIAHQVEYFSKTASDLLLINDPKGMYAHWMSSYR